jgi:hypothetical protein
MSMSVEDQWGDNEREREVRLEMLTGTRSPIPRREFPC